MLASFQLVNSQGLCLSGINFGATLTSLKIPIKQGVLREVLLGCPLEQYPHQDVWLGAVAGRFANRIANATLISDQQQWQLDTNQPPHCLHGGKEGFQRKYWRIEQQQQDNITLSLLSPHGDQGFPGNLHVELQYRLENYDLVIEFHAYTDALTPVSLTSHAYFNLNQDHQQNILDHKIQLRAKHYLSTTPDGIPLTMTQVSPEFDLNEPQKILNKGLSHPQQQQAKGFDHAFILSPSESDWQACLISGDNQLTMQMFTNQPSIQFYTGNWLANTPNREGGTYGDYAGLCLEAQQLPDSPNRPELGNPWLKKGEIYHHITRYRFIV